MIKNIKKLLSVSLLDRVTFAPLSRSAFASRMSVLSILILSALTLAACDKEEEIIVAVASNFIQPAKQIAQAFEDETQSKVRLVFGSSGKIYAQIKNGAPFDVFLSADQTKPEALISSGDAVASSQQTYAQGQLVLWSSEKHKDIKHDFIAGRYRFIAIANPKLAPYGIAASSVLEKYHSENTLDANVDSITQSKIVMGENVSQVFQFIVSGNADMGFIALSQIKSNEMIKESDFWLVPKDDYAPILQDAVLLQRSSQSLVAKEFLKFLKSEKATSIMKNYGYQIAP